MKAIYLTKNGEAKDAFQIKEIEKPNLESDEVLIKVEAFGLNFADVMARMGLYKDCPPLPAVIGYDVVGKIEAVGPDVENVKIGERVTALTRFGAYAEYAKTKWTGLAKIPNEMPSGTALALATQGCTAYYCAEEMVRIYENDKVLIHAAAGGVGTLLVQLAKHRGAYIYGTSSKQKHTFLKEQGVDMPIDYRTVDFAEVLNKEVGKEGLDVIFDPVGGASFKKGFELLGSGGRIVTFGGSSATNTNNLFGKLKFAKEFGIFHPLQFIGNSKSVLGVNMLRIADNRPLVFNRILNKVVQLAEEGILKPTTGKTFTFEEIADAHEHLQSRASIGKIIITIP